MKKNACYSKSDIPIIYLENIDLKIAKDFHQENKIIYEVVKFLLDLKSWDIVIIFHEQTPWKKAI